MKKRGLLFSVLRTKIVTMSLRVPWLICQHRMKEFKIGVFQARTPTVTCHVSGPNLVNGFPVPFMSN